MLPYILIAGHREIMNGPQNPYWLALTVLEGAMQAAGGKRHQDLDLVCCITNLTVKMCLWVQ